MCLHLPADELNTLINDCLLSADPSVDWTLRRGRSAALFIALKEVFNQIYSPKRQDKRYRVFLSYMATDCTVFPLCRTALDRKTIVFVFFAKLLVIYLFSLTTSFSRVISGLVSCFTHLARSALQAGYKAFPFPPHSVAK